MSGDWGTPAANDDEPVDDDDMELAAALRGIIEERLAGMDDDARNDAMLGALAQADGRCAVDDDNVVDVESVVDEATRRARSRKEGRS